MNLEPKQAVPQTELTPKRCFVRFRVHLQEYIVHFVPGAQNGGVPGYEG